MGILAALASVYSIYLGVVFDRGVSASISKPRSGFTPRVALIMPCKGAEPGLEANIEAVLKQDYKTYFTIIVTDSAQDPAYAIAASVLARHSSVKAQIHLSRPSNLASGKVAALLTALSKTKGQADVYAFVDSDALIPPNWLTELVDPLVGESVGATTGFRWYFPSHGGFWSHVEAAWNASGTNLLFDNRYNFPWGGAMALRAETLDKIGIEKVWANAVSDDMSLNSVLRRHGYQVIFLPQCTVATFNRTDLTRFLEWATRQTTLTKTFNPGLWKYALTAYAFFDLAFLLGALGLGLGVALNAIWFVPSALLLSTAVLGVFRARQRYSTFKRALPHFTDEFEKNSLPSALASFLVPWIMTYCIIRSALTDEIEWRGRKYKLTRIKGNAAKPSSNHPS